MFGNKPCALPPIQRPAVEMDIKVRPDRVGRYFKKYMEKFVFAEFSPEYMEKAGIKEIMNGIPIPLRKEDLEVFNGGAGLKATHIGENMAWVMGIDPHFKHTVKYVEFLSKLFNYKIYEGMMKEGRNEAEDGEFDAAAIHFRAALCMKPDYLHAMYSYARVCRELYCASNNDKKTGRFKAESMEYFELTTETHPKFAQAFYYLGYSYLNLGLYIKAELAWKEFLTKTKIPKDRKEIKERLEQIAAPIKIEKGCNEILAGRNEIGIEILEPYLKTNFKTWWPLSYYLGVGYIQLGRQVDAVTSFKRVLSMNGSHIETMKELVLIYKKDGDKENEQKYKKKIDLIEKDNQEKADHLADSEAQE
jgi:tetratricopeptide (TPR) repeat protein